MTKKELLSEQIYAEMADAMRKYEGHPKQQNILQIVDNIFEASDMKMSGEDIKWAVPINTENPSDILSALKIAERLMEGLPLTAIEDKPHEWRGETIDIAEPDEIAQVYQAVRRPSLKKFVSGNSKNVWYFDRDIVDCIDINHPTDIATSDTVSHIVNEMFPIQLPYLPTKKYRAYVRIDYGPKGMLTILKLLLPSGIVMDINRNFKWDEEKSDWSEIDSQEKPSV